MRATDGRDIRLWDDGTYEPVFTIADIPPVAPPSLGVTQPAIYYGEEDFRLSDRQSMIAEITARRRVTEPLTELVDVFLAAE